jgi:hypothetical protein
MGMLQVEQISEICVARVGFPKRTTSMMSQKDRQKQTWKTKSKNSMRKVNTTGILLSTMYGKSGCGVKWNWMRFSKFLFIYLALWKLLAF